MWALQDARLPTGAIADVVIDGDRIARLGPGAADGLKDRLDCSGKLVLPGFVDGHVHLDKVLIRDELREHDGTLAGAIGAIHERKRRYTVEDVRARARTVIEDSVRHHRVDQGRDAVAADDGGIPGHSNLLAVAHLGRATRDGDALAPTSPRFE